MTTPTPSPESLTSEIQDLIAQNDALEDRITQLDVTLGERDRYIAQLEADNRSARDALHKVQLAIDRIKL